MCKWILPVMGMLAFGGMVKAANETAATASTVVIADFKRALHSVDHGKKAKDALEKESKDRQKKLESEQEAIQKATEDFRKQSMVLSGDAREKKQGELQERMMKFQQGVQKNQMEIQKRERDLVDPIIDGMQKVLQDLAKEKKYDLVLDTEQSVLYASPGVKDVTNELIEAYNKQNKGKSLPGLK